MLYNQPFKEQNCQLDVTESELGEEMLSTA